MKVEITEYDDGKKCLAFDDVIITERLGDFYVLAPGYKVPEGCTVLDPLGNISIKKGSVYFNEICVDKIIACPEKSPLCGYSVLLVSDGVRGHKTATNVASVVKVVFDGEGLFDFNESTGEMKPYASN